MTKKKAAENFFSSSFYIFAIFIMFTINEEAKERERETISFIRLPILLALELLKVKMLPRTKKKGGERDITFGYEYKMVLHIIHECTISLDSFPLTL